MRLVIRFFLLLLSSLSCSVAWAAPSVSGVTGSLTTGATLQVSGSNFTSLSTTVYVLDRFETGSRDTYWASDASRAPKVTTALTQRSANSIYHSTCNFSYSNQDDSSYKGDGATVDRYWFCSYFVRVAADWDWGTSSFLGTDKWLSNIKLFRMWNPGSTIVDLFFAYDGTGNEIQINFENMGTGGATITRYSNYNPMRTLFAKDVWHQLTFEWVDSSANNVADGSIKFWVDGTIMYSSANAVLQVSDAGFKRPFINGGWQNEWGPDESTPDTDGYQTPNSMSVDDVLNQAGSISRMFLSTNSTVNSGAQMEFLKVLSWSASSIQAEYNPGDKTGQLYLYVCDSAGSCNSNGFALTATAATNLNPVVQPGVSVSSFSVNWSSAGAQYVVAISTSSDFIPVISSGPLTALTTSFSNLSSRTTYYVAVKNSTNSTFTDTFSTLTAWTPLNPSVGGQTQSSLDGSWVSALSVKIIWDDNSDFSSPISSGTASSPDTLSGQVCNTTYYFRTWVATESYNSASAGNSTSGTTSACSGVNASRTWKITGPGNFNGRHKFQ